MKILITGATGLIGNELVKKLLASNHYINILSTSKQKVLPSENFKSFYWDPQSGIIDLKAFEGVEVVINLAGATISKRWTDAYKEEILNSRIISTNLLYLVIKENNFPIKKFVNASAIGIYKSDMKKVYHENDEIYSDSFLSEVAKKWEASAMQLEQINIPIIIVRIGVVLSKTGGALQEMLKPIKKGFGAAISPGSQYISWIHLDDVVSIFCYLISNDKVGVFNAVSPYPVTNKKMNLTIAKTINKRIYLPNVPQFVIKLILGEMHHLVTESQNVSAFKLLKEDFTFKFATLENALENLLKTTNFSQRI